MQARILTVSGRRRAFWRTAGMLVLITVIGNVPLSAQYISPGVVETTRAIPDKEVFDKSIDQVGWNLGSLRVRPWYGLRDAAFVSTRDQETATSEEDFTLTFGAGLRAYLPTGKLMWSAHALPEYVWWQDDEAKRGLNGRYGLGVFGYFNRLRFEVSGRRVERQEFFSAEVQELTSTAIDTSRLSVEVDVARRLGLFGSAELRTFRSEEVESALFPRLDRDEDVFTVGLRYHSPRGWYTALALEDRTTEFPAEARDLSNSGTSELLELGFTGGRFGARLALAFRDLEADAGSDFGRFNETTGSLEILGKPSARVALLTYARRGQTFSVDLRNAFILSERQGVRFNYTYRSSVFGVFAEVGEDELAAVGSLVAQRIDDVNVLGADVRFDIGDLLGVSLQVLYSEYDSNFDSFDRDVTDVGFSVQLGSLIDKLRLGQAAEDW